MRLALWLGLTVVALVPITAAAQELPELPSEETLAVPVAGAEEFYRAEVVAVEQERRDELGINGTQPIVQTVRLRFLDGPRHGEEETIEYGVLLEAQALAAGDTVIVVSVNDTIYIFDRYRLPALGGIAVLFAGFALVFAGWRGLTSIVGLGVSILVLALYVVPQIMAGANPLTVSLIGAFVIALVSLYLAHGFNKRTTVALVSTLLTVVLAIGLAQLFVAWASMTGTGSEEAYHLQTSPAGFVNLKGLLLGGIIIGALGVLDDITTSQTAAVYQIWRANPALTARELFRRGAAVGREHITSLINTLALAYVGASLPALLLFTVYRRPWWVVANTETIAEEIIRTLVGSTALMLAVPITTYIAAAWLSRRQADTSEDAALTHQH